MFLTADMTARATSMSLLLVLQQVVGSKLVFAAGVACCIKLVISDARASKWPLLQFLELLLVAMILSKRQNPVSTVWRGNAG